MRDEFAHFGIACRHPESLGGTAMPIRRRTLRIAALAVAAVTLLGLAGIAPRPAAADQPVPVPSSKTFTIAGRGWGHGRGMSQYGALAAAQTGETWREILSFYYSGTQLAPVSNSTITVGLLGNVGNTARLAGRSGLTATDGAGQTVSLPTTSSGAAILAWRIVANTSSSNGNAVDLQLQTSSGTSTYKSSTSGHWQISASDGNLTVLPSSGTSGTQVIGALIGDRSGSSMIPVLSTSLENYVRQVVPWESPGNWPVDALAAQAVAARSYGEWYREHPRTSQYDICDTTSCQVFGGISGESTNSAQAVSLTAHIAIKFQGAVVRSEFGSSNGGAIAGSTLPQQAKLDVFERSTPWWLNTWQTTVSASTLQSIWPSVGTVTSLTVTSRDGNGMWGGRVTGMRLTGTNGSVTFSGYTFQYYLGLRSTYFNVIRTPAQQIQDFTGDGYGDLVSISGQGTLQVSPGTPAGRFLDPHTISTSTAWGGYSQVLVVPSINGDHWADIVWMTSSGAFYDANSVIYGLNTTDLVTSTGMSDYRNCTGLADVRGNGTSSILCIRRSDNALVRFDSDGAGNISSTVHVITPSGWNGASYNYMFGSGDVTGDGRSDLLVRDSSGNILAWQGNGSGGFTSSVKLFSGFQGYRDLTSPGDMNGDGLSDIVARTSTGATSLFLSTGPMTYAAPVPLATSVDHLLP